MGCAHPNGFYHQLTISKENKGGGIFYQTGSIYMTSYGNIEYELENGTKYSGVAIHGNEWIPEKKGRLVTKQGDKWFAEWDSGQMSRNIRGELASGLNIDIPKFEQKNLDIKLSVKIKKEEYKNIDMMYFVDCLKNPPVIPEGQETINLTFEGQTSFQIKDDQLFFDIKEGEISILQVLRIKGKAKNNLPEGDFTIYDLAKREKLTCEYIDGIQIGDPTIVKFPSIKENTMTDDQGTEGRAEGIEGRAEGTRII